MPINCTPNALAEASKCYCFMSARESSAAMIYLLCQWANSEVIPPSVLFEWQPHTSFCHWHDVTGNHAGDYTVFVATSDYDTVDRLDFGGAGDLTALLHLSDLPALYYLKISNNPITSIDFTGCQLTTISGFSSGLLSIDVHGMTTLIDLTVNSSAGLASVDASGCTALVNATFYGCNLGPINLTGDFAITTLDINSNPAPVVTGP